MIYTQSTQANSIVYTSIFDTIPYIDTIKQLSSNNMNSYEQPEEIFIDSINIGRKTFNKIELFKYRTLDSNYVVLKFYSKRNGKWYPKNSFQFEKDGVLSCDPKLGDFNNDKLNDFTYISAIAARSANQVRRLFVYDKQKDQLVDIKNSSDYPNMLYNKELNCIDAFLIFGGCSTVFLKLDGDSLRELASVELYDGLTVTVYDKNGKGKIIYRNKKVKDRYIRYKNYHPLKEYTVYY